MLLRPQGRPRRRPRLLAHRREARQGQGSDPVRLLQLRNPWGNFEWTGRWSDASAEWTTHKKVAKACGVDPGKPSDDGVFWMAYEDFLAYFDSIDVLKRTEDLHDIYLDTHEDMKPRVFGPLRGCVVGLCRYFVACQGAEARCGRAPTGDDTVEVDQKRLLLRPPVALTCAVTFVYSTEAPPLMCQWRVLSMMSWRALSSSRFRCSISAWGVPCSSRVCRRAWPGRARP